MSITALSKEDLMQQQILQAAQKLFMQYGRHKVTMDDVAREIGKGRSSLYYYYKSKDEIWDAVIIAEFEKILNAIDKAVRDHQTTESKLQAFCITKLQLIRNAREIYHVATAKNGAENVLKHNNVRRSRYLKKEGVILHGIIADGVASGELRPLGENETEVLVFVLISGLHGLEKEIVVEENTLKSAVMVLCDVILNGLKA